MNIDSIKMTLSQFARGDRGSVAVISALTLPVLLGFAALSLEYGNALVTRSETQRVVDVATFTAAVAYRNAGGDQETRRNAARNAARSISGLNGVEASRVDIIFEPGEDGNDALVQATIASTQKLFLARILDPKEELTVSVRAVARIGEETGAACILALSENGDGLDMNGSTTLRAAECGVASNSRIFLNSCSDRIITNKTVKYRTSLTNRSSPECVPDKKDQGVTSNYIADERGAALSAVNASFPLPAPIITTNSGYPNFDINYNVNSTRAAALAAGQGNRFWPKLLRYL